MPRVLVNGIALYYEVHGTGEPFLLIQGLGFPLGMWFRQLPVFSREFLTIIFDNRGAGKTDKPDEEYTIRLMADDAVALLDTLGIGEAHILGVSVGGLIAQEIALEYPSRVKKLILLSTHSGGAEYFEVTQALWKEIFTVAHLRLDEIYRKGFRYALTPRFFREYQEVVERLVRIRCESPQPAHAFRRQWEAAYRFDATERLDSIKAPTLVISGTEDLIVPVDFSRRLARSIPGARFRTIEGAGHLAFIEKPDEVNRMVSEFLRAPS